MAGIAATLMAIPAQSLLAQNQPAPAMPSNQELQAVASAYVSAAEIRRNYDQKIQATEDKAKRDALQEQARKDMTAAIKSKGVKIPRYNEILNLAQNNEDLRERLVGYIKKVQE
jgi:hypothetical protein